MKSEKISFSYAVSADGRDLESDDRILVDSAVSATRNAYAPYSGFRVGCALRLANGEIVMGNNQENAAYPSGMCAERVTIFAARANYPNILIESVAIAIDSGFEEDIFPVAPCGACRQVLLEYEILQSVPIRLLLKGDSSKVVLVNRAVDLLPLHFMEQRLKNG